MLLESFSKNIEFSLPVYYTREYARKPSRTFLVSLNWYRNAHYSEQNAVKAYYTELITPLVSSLAPITGQYGVIYKYHYKNPSSDLGNVVSMTSKWLNDVLQAEGKVSNDNVRYLTNETFLVGGQDKENPRCHVIITTPEI